MHDTKKFDISGHITRRGLKSVESVRDESGYTTVTNSSQISMVQNGKCLFLTYSTSPYVYLGCIGGIRELTQ